MSRAPGKTRDDDVTSIREGVTKTEESKVTTWMHEAFRRLGRQVLDGDGVTWARTGEIALEGASV